MQYLQLSAAQQLPILEDVVTAVNSESVLAAHSIGDGLPVLAPTENRLAQMLDGVDDPGQDWGVVPPLSGRLTTTAAAYFAVVAGCRPHELSAVLGAVRACLQPEFNLLGSQTTTGTAAIAVVFHGPLVEQLGLNYQANCLGPGNRANACIGRAIALTLAALGGARPGVTDMATMGQPGKYTFCFAESPFGHFAGLVERKGLAPNSSAVTVLSVSGTCEVVPFGGGGTLNELLDPVAYAIAGAACAGAGPGPVDSYEQFLLIPPEVAMKLLRLGYSLDDIQRRLFASATESLERALAGTSYLTEGHRRPRAAREPSDIHPIVTGGVGTKMQYLPLWRYSHSVTQLV